MNNAIKLAIEKGGYDHDYQFLIDMKDGRGDTMFLLDPLFWQALGKALGWGIEPSGSIWKGREQWKLYAQEYFDLVLTGGDTEEFWKQLLTLTV